MCKNKSWKIWTRRFGKGWYGNLDASEQGRAGLKIRDFGSMENLIFELHRSLAFKS